MTFINRLKGYQLVYSEQAKKFLKKIDKSVSLKIAEKLEELVNGSKNLDVKKLHSLSARYRLRVGQFRVIYEIVDEQVVVYVIKIGDRKEIYRG